MNYLRLFLIFCLMGCSVERPSTKLSKVRSLHFKDQWKKYKLRPNMTGEGGDGKQLNLIYLGFSTREPLTIESARRLVMTSAHDFLKLLEDCEEIYPYLFQLPFPYEKLQYEISSVDENGIVDFSENDIENDKISYVIFSHGGLRYNNFIRETNSIKNIYKETYEEALRILAEEEKAKQEQES